MLLDGERRKTWSCPWIVLAEIRKSKGNIHTYLRLPRASCAAETIGKEISTPTSSLAIRKARPSSSTRNAVPGWEDKAEFADLLPIGKEIRILVVLMVVQFL